MSYSLLLDIGNVIVGFDYLISVRRIAALCSSPPEQILDQVDCLKDGFESGRITPDEFLEEASSRIGYSGERESLVEAFEEIFELNRPMASLVEEESKRKTPLYLLSNTNGIHLPYLLRTFPVFGFFDDAIYSHEVFAMKPDSQIYETAISRLQLDPGRTIYVDDLPDNCEAGRSHGFQVIQYDITDHSRFLDQFEDAKRAIEAR